MFNKKQLQHGFFQTEHFTGTLIPTIRPTSTQALLRQRLYRTSEAPLKLSHVCYNLTIYCVAHKPITTLWRLLTNVKDKDKPEDTQGAARKIKCCDSQATSIGETGRNLTARDWRNTSERQEMVTSTVTLLSTIYRRNIKSTRTLRHVLRILQTTINDSLKKAGFSTNLEQTPLNRSPQLPAPYKWRVDGIKQK